VAQEQKDVGGSIMKSRASLEGGGTPDSSGGGSSENRVNKKKGLHLTFKKESALARRRKGAERSGTGLDGKRR